LILELEQMTIKFPDNFLWGTSTAAAQIETASDHNWKNFKSRDGYTFLRTSDHEKRRDEDLEYIRQFGSIYRCGVDWARLQPAPMADFEQDVVKEYQDFFQKLLDADMRIMFVFHHFCNPMWFENNGTWLNLENIPAFMDFAKKCMKHFGDYAYIFNTFNEPGVYALNGFMIGNFPPQKRGYFKGNRVLAHMGEAHDELYDLLKAKYPEKQVGISKNTGTFFGTNWLGKWVAKKFDWWFHDKSSSYFEKNDFWGISYYVYMPFNPYPISEVDYPGKLKKMGIPNDKMWGYHPKGLKDILLRYHKKYNKPIIITENGVCTDDDEFRQQSLKDYLHTCHEAMQEGADLRGYIHWTTIDNFEWNLGPTYRFGLVHVDFDTMNRTMTGAGKFYKKITEENAVTL